MVRVVGAGRVRRPEQAVRLQRALQVAVEHAGLDHRAAVARADVEDAVHALERHHHAACDRHRGAGGVGAAAARDHRHAVRAAGAHQRDDLLARGRQRHRIGQRLPARVVVAVGQAFAGSVQPAVAEQCGQFASTSAAGRRAHRTSSARNASRSQVRRGAVGIAVGLDHVEAARRVGEFAMRGEEHLRGVHQLAALAGIDRRRAAAEAGVAAIAHFDEHQRRVAAPLPSSMTRSSSPKR